MVIFQNTRKITQMITIVVHKRRFGTSIIKKINKHIIYTIPVITNVKDKYDNFTSISPNYFN